MSTLNPSTNDNTEKILNRPMKMIDADTNHTHTRIIDMEQDSALINSCWIRIMATETINEVKEDSKIYYRDPKKFKFFAPINKSAPFQDRENQLRFSSF